MLQASLKNLKLLKWIITIENIKFKYSLIKDPSETSLLEYIKQILKHTETIVSTIKKNTV